MLVQGQTGGSRPGWYSRIGVRPQEQRRTGDPAMTTRTQNTSWPAAAFALAGLFLVAAGAWSGPHHGRPRQAANPQEAAARPGTASSRTSARAAPPAVRRSGPAVQARTLEA